MMLPEEVIDEYLNPLTSDQAHAIRSIRALLLELSPSLVEKVDDGKWFRGLLTYAMPDGPFAYALGPRAGATTFHMMPYYGSRALQERHGPALRNMLTGKSCIRLKRYEEVPEDALRDIIACGPAVMGAMLDMAAERTPRKRSGAPAA